MKQDARWLKSLIREVPDYPKPGILFKDISPLLADPKSLKRLIELLAAQVSNKSVTKIVGIESRGFILGSALALHLGVGFVMARKRGKLPWKTIKHSYSLEYGEDCIEMHEDALAKGERVLIVDDVLATGGTALAAIELCKKLGADVEGILLLIELMALKGRERLAPHTVHSVVSF